MTSKFRHYHYYKLFCRLVKRETEEVQWPIGPRLYASKMYNQLWNFHDRLVHGSLCIRNFARCNSRLSISPEYVPFTGVIGVGSPVWEWMGGVDRRTVPDAVSRSMPGPHLSIDIVGGGMGETLQNGRGRLQVECDWRSAMPYQHLDDGLGNRRAPLPPTSDATGQSVDVAVGWARKTAHLSKCRRGARQHKRLTPLSPTT